MIQYNNQFNSRFWATADVLRANSTLKLRGHSGFFLVFILTASLFILPSVAITECTWSSLIGDVDGNEQITPGDALEIFWSSINGSWTSMDNYCCLDANRDETVTPGDALMVFWYSIYGGPVEGVTGNVGELCISDCETVTDIDGNEYQTVMIGEQCWMAENLKVTHYRNGDPIPNVIDNTEWVNLSTGAYCTYDNDSTNVTIYGRLYNWYALDDDRNIAPEGWHVPTMDDWGTLKNYLGGFSVAGGKMKATGTIEGEDGLWRSPNTGATNESGFTGLPGGFRSGSIGSFQKMGESAWFWISPVEGSEHAHFNHLRYNYESISQQYGDYKNYGISVRCVKD